jgi:hypothetical protein
MRQLIRKILKEEIIKEGYIDVPKNEILKSGVLLDLINSNIEKYKKEEVDYYSRIVDFKDFFKLNDNEGNPINISVGIYNDDSDIAGARMDAENNTLLINVSSWSEESPINLDDFEDLITHELVHSVDPLVKNKEIYKKYYEKKGAEPTGNPFVLDKRPNIKSEYDINYEKYRKSQHEYKAELTPLINRIDKLVKGDKYKIEWVFWLLSIIEKYNTPRDMYFDTKSYFEDNGGSPFKISEDNYWNFIYYLFNVVKPWSSKPTLMRSLKKELYSALS